MASCASTAPGEQFASQTYIWLAGSGSAPPRVTFLYPVSSMVPRHGLAEAGRPRDPFFRPSRAKEWAGQDSNLGRALARVVYSHVLLAAQVPARVAPIVKSWALHRRGTRGFPLLSFASMSPWRGSLVSPFLKGTRSIALSYVCVGKGKRGFPFPNPFPFLKGIQREKPVEGFEPPARSLQKSCSTN